MSFDEDSEFYSEGVPLQRVHSERKTFWLITATIVMLIATVSGVLLMPLLSQQRHLAKLREEGGMLFTSSRDSWWTDLAEQIQQYAGISPPVMQELHQIHLDDGGVSNELLRSLKQFPELRVISLENASVSAEVLEELIADLPELDGLSIVNCPQVKTAWVRRMRADHPGLSLEYRGPAYLGISTNLMAPESAGCMVMYVQPGTPAAGCGLRSGDVITGIDDRDVQTFSELVMILAEYGPGDEIEVRFRRKGEALRRSCELESWEMMP